MSKWTLEGEGWWGEYGKLLVAYIYPRAGGFAWSVYADGEECFAQGTAPTLEAAQEAADAAALGLLREALGDAGPAWTQEPPDKPGWWWYFDPHELGAYSASACYWVDAALVAYGYAPGCGRVSMNTSKLDGYWMPATVPEPPKEETE